MRLLLLCLLLCSGGLAAQQFTVSWNSCNSIDVCVGNYPESVFTSFLNNPNSALRAQVTIQGAFDNVTIPNIGSGECVTIDDLELEQVLTVTVLIPTIVPFFCEPARSSFFPFRMIGCRGNLQPSVQTIEVGSRFPVASGCFETPSSNWCSSSNTYCSSDIDQGLIMRTASFGGETNFRVNIYGPSNGNYQTSGWFGRPINDQNGSEEINLLDDIWRNGGSSWKFWPNSQPYRVEIVVIKPGCTSWKAYDFFFTVNGNCLVSDDDNPSFLGATTDGSSKVFPNPFNNEVTISNILGDEIKAYTYSLMDVNGQLLRKQLVLSSNYTIDTEELPGGLYFLRIEDQQGNLIENKKLIKR